jgi:large subunit ribosomal protein L10Ae
MKKQPVIQVKVGKKSMESNDLLENMKAVVDYIVDLMPHKYNNVKSMFLKTTMGHPVRIDNEYLTNLGV